MDIYLNVMVRFITALLVFLQEYVMSLRDVTREVFDFRVICI